MMSQISESRFSSPRTQTASLLLTVVVCLLAVMAAPLAFGQPVADQSAEPVRQAALPRTISEWNLQISGRRRIALKGFDPVSYFPEGGGTPQRGEPNFSVSFRSVSYFFVSAENRDRFAKNPYRYEPAFGGWCAWAMSKGDKTEIDPKSFLVRDDRLYVFYKGLFGNTRKDWLRGDHDALSQKADTNWRRIANEGPRHFALLTNKPDENGSTRGTGPVAPTTDDASGG